MTTTYTLSAVFAANLGYYLSISSDQPVYIFTNQFSYFINIFCCGYTMKKSFRYCLRCLNCHSLSIRS